MKKGRWKLLAMAIVGDREHKLPSPCFGLYVHERMVNQSGTKSSPKWIFSLKNHIIKIMTEEEKREYQKQYRLKHKAEYTAYQKKWRLANKERINELARKRYQENLEKSRLSVKKSYQKHRKRREQYLLFHKEEIRAQQKRWREANKEQIKEYMREYSLGAKARIRIFASSKVNNTLKSGKLIKQPCEMCGCLEVEAHHSNYNEPLNVMWLCKKCHEEWHKHNEPIY